MPQDLDYTRETRSEKKQSAALEGVNGPVGIRNGVQCINWVVDQNTVIFLLNRIPSTSGGTLFPSGPTRFKEPRQGFCDPSLSDAIRRFQQANGLKPDGVVDPGGPTSARMRALATGIRPQSNGASADAGEFIDRVQELIDLLQLLSERLRGTPQGGQFQSLAVELQQLLARSGTPRPSRPLPVRNVAILEIAVIAAAVIVAILAITAVLVGPKPQKGVDIKGLTDELIEGIAARVRRAQQLLLGLLASVFGTIANALSRLNDLAHQITRKTGTCGDQFAEFETQTTKLVFVLSLPGTRLPSPTRLGEVPDIIKIGRDWLKSLVDLIGCLGAAGFPILQFLHAPLQGGLTLLDLMVKFLFGGNLPNALRLAR